MSLGAETEFIRSFMLQHGDRLKRFAVLRTPLRPQSLQLVTQMGVSLMQLFVSMWKSDLVGICISIGCATN